MQRTTQPPTKARLRRTRTDIPEALLQSALVEFGAKGFDGASTRAIAARVEVHSRRPNHFESKTAVWTAAVDHLFGRDPKRPTWIHAHADGLVTILLPGPAGL
jgi:TetR/AcrR family transcriptional regulator